MLLSLDGGSRGVDMDGPYHQVEGRDLFPTSSINSEASVAHLVGSGDNSHRARCRCHLRTVLSYPPCPSRRDDTATVDGDTNGSPASGQAYRSLGHLAVDSPLIVQHRQACQQVIKPEASRLFSPFFYRPMVTIGKLQAHDLTTL